MTLTTYLGFVGASVLLSLAPGPDNIFVLTQGITRGRKAALASACGMCSGVTVHTIAAALGASAIFYSSALAFNLVKYAGAAYLLFLAYKTIRSSSSIHLSSAAEGDAWALFKRGFIMNVLNPKVAMFFLAFLPQFISPGAKYFTLQMIFLGITFMVQALAVFSLIGIFSGSIGNYILSRPRIARRFEWLTAGVFGALGLRMALMER
ncbi:LysE family translocator [Holophaga foetida]|uniref:LysE family translocator n=1 Tax=Holophaga foetida TaxID=35839 RepID=UPI0002475356|nr:LysE family translocator [Holophaga foetida]